MTRVQPDSGSSKPSFSRYSSEQKKQKTLSISPLQLPSSQLLKKLKERASTHVPNSQEATRIASLSHLVLQEK